MPPTARLHKFGKGAERWVSPAQEEGNQGPLPIWALEMLLLWPGAASDRHQQVSECSLRKGQAHS